jgi:palmitoyltransferase
MIYILAVVLFLAVGIMGGYHFWGVANGETSIEAQDNEVYRSKAKTRGEVRFLGSFSKSSLVLTDVWKQKFVNSYDLG